MVLQSDYQRLTQLRGFIFEFPEAAYRRAASYCANLSRSERCPSNPTVECSPVMVARRFLRADPLPTWRTCGMVRTTGSSLRSAGASHATNRLEPHVVHSLFLLDTTNWQRVQSLYDIAGIPIRGANARTIPTSAIVVIILFSTCDQIDTMRMARGVNERQVWKPSCPDSRGANL
jgi:hypothetical protein